MFAPSTGQIIIDICFLLILVCHIIKIDYLWRENRRIYRMLTDLFKSSKYLHKGLLDDKKHISKLQDLIKELLQDLKDMGL